MQAGDELSDGNSPDQGSKKNFIKEKAKATPKAKPKAGAKPRAKMEQISMVMDMYNPCQCNSSPSVLISPYSQFHVHGPTSSTECTSYNHVNSHNFLIETRSLCASPW